MVWLYMKSYHNALYIDDKFQKINPTVRCYEITRQLVLLVLGEHY